MLFSFYLFLISLWNFLQVHFDGEYFWGITSTVCDHSNYPLDNCNKNHEYKLVKLSSDCLEFEIFFDLGNDTILKDSFDLTTDSEDNIYLLSGSGSSSPHYICRIFPSGEFDQCANIFGDSSDSTHEIRYATAIKYYNNS